MVYVVVILCLCAMFYLGFIQWKHKWWKDLSF